MTNMTIDLNNPSEEDYLWLARNIYFEARGESFDGRLGVAMVTLNRVFSKKFPNTIKEVVTQPKQFSWFNVGFVPGITEEKAWKECQEMAIYAIDLYNSERLHGLSVDSTTQGADHYFAEWIQPPSWAKKMKFLKKIGQHLFYIS